MSFRTAADSRTTSWPNTRASPLVGRRSEQIILMKVVLPAPFGPRIPKIVPDSICSDNRSTATVWRGGVRVRTDFQPDWWRKTFVRLTASIAVIGGAPRPRGDGRAQGSRRTSRIRRARAFGDAPRPPDRHGGVTTMTDFPEFFPWSASW